MARFTEWSPELESELARPFPREWEQTKRQGSATLTFVGWHFYVHRLNELVGPGWSMGEPILREVGGKLIMGTPVTILGVTRVNFGSEEEEHGNAEEVDDGKGGTKKVVRDYGSAETNSFAQAFKRTCSLFGLGLYMYDKGGKMRSQAPRTASEPQTQTRQGESKGDRVQPHQRKMPIGTHNKGVPLGDISDKDLQSALDWCEKTDAKKFADLMNDIRFVLASRTTPEPGDDLPALSFD